MSGMIPAEESLYAYAILGSRFLALLVPLERQEDFEPKLTEIKERYPKASHYCYGVRVRSFEGCSDDGEPARSAGIPLLDLLRRKEIVAGLLVVIRYFGGIKLGAGRLTRVYRETATKCLNQATFAEIRPGEEVELEVDYPTFESLKKQAERNGVSLKVLFFDERVRLLLRGDAKIIASWLAGLPQRAIRTRRDIEFQRRIEHDSKQ